jgi:hypothetical protein
MKRLFLFLGVVILGTTWSSAAHAQYGGFGNTPDVNAEIDNQRSHIKQQMRQYAKPQGRSSRTSALRQGAAGAADRYGRIDMAGKPVAGYPAVRGDLTGQGSTRVSRGGANGTGKRGLRARRAK